MKTSAAQSQKASSIPKADFLVIGSGVAGLRAALELSREGRVIMLTKGHPLQSSSIYAQGGVAVALSEEDDVAIHLTDTLKAGHGLCRPEAVRVLVEEGPERIQELIGWGAKFDKVDGKFAFAREAAHSRSRILRARGDATGNEMVRVLMAEVTRQKRIQRLDYHFTVDLVVEDGRCCGAVVLDESRRPVRYSRESSRVIDGRRRADLCPNDEPSQCHRRWYGDGVSGRSRAAGYGVRPVSSDLALSPFESAVFAVRSDARRRRAVA